MQALSQLLSSAAAAGKQPSTVQVNGWGWVLIKLYLHKQAEGQICPTVSSLSAPGPGTVIP